MLAGYGHAAYEQGEFGRTRRGASEANRRELRAVVGDAAEAIIADYGGFDWNRIAARRDIDEVRALSKHEQQLLFLHIVNELDDSFDCGVYDAKWCEGCLNRLTAGAEFAKVLGFNDSCRSTECAHQLRPIPRIGLDQRRQAKTVRDDPEPLQQAEIVAQTQASRL